MPYKRYKKMESAAADLARALANPDRKPDDFTLGRIAYGLYDLARKLPSDPEGTGVLIEMTKRLRSAQGPGRQMAEEKMMEQMTFIMHRASERIEKTHPSGLLEFSSASEIAPALQPVIQVVRALCEYAVDCLEFRRPRDSFGGRRREAAYEILADACTALEMPAVVELARQGLRRRKGGDVAGAASLLKRYYVTREHEPEEEVIDELLRAAEKASSRSAAVSALDALVETGAISEFEALDRIDKWKDEHGYNAW